MSEPRTGRIAAIVLLLAGAAMAAGALLAWLQLSSKGIAFAEGSVVGQASGIDATYGWVVLAAGVITILIALVAVSTGRRGRTASVVVLVAALAAGGAVGYVAATVRERFVDFAVDTASSSEFTADEVRAEMDELFVQNAVDVGPGVGLIAAGAGAALAAIAAVGSLVAGRRREPSGADDGTKAEQATPTDEPERTAADRPEAYMAEKEATAEGEPPPAGATGSAEGTLPAEDANADPRPSRFAE